MELQAVQDLQEVQVLLDLKVQQVPLEIKVQQVLQVPLEIKVPLAHKVCKGPQHPFQMIPTIESQQPWEVVP